MNIKRNREKKTYTITLAVFKLRGGFFFTNFAASNARWGSNLCEKLEIWVIIENDIWIHMLQLFGEKL